VRLLRPHARRWAGLAVLVATSSLLLLAGPLVIRRIVDRATTGAETGELQRLAIVFLVIVLIGQVAEIVVVRAATVSAWRTTNQLRLDMTDHVLGLDHEFHRRHTPGELIQRVDGDVTSVSDLLGRVVPRALGAVLLIIGMVIVVALVDWRIGLGMLVYVAVAFGLILLLRERAVDESTDELSAFARLYGGIEERLNAAEDIRANGAGGHAMWRFVEESADSLGSSVRRESAFLGMWWSVRAVVVGGTVISLAASALLVSRGSMSIGTAFLLFQYVLLIERPLDEVVHELETVQKATGAMRRVADLLAVEATILDQGTTSPRTGALAVRFAGVGFDYGDDQPVLRDVTVDVGAGRSVGIVGRTGSGKTTFSRLVLRLVEATDGAVELGGVPIAEIPLRELRRRVAMVPQEVELFSGTVRENVTLFDPAPSSDDVVAALRAVGLDALADAGIDRSLGAGGAGLSAGEAQLLAMARVWLRNADLVVLDEATARIDPETERRLEEAVQRLMRGRTTLIIAHRLSTLREVDDIIVFDDGAVLEHGARDELAADPSSRFHRLLALALETGGAADVDLDPDDDRAGDDRAGDDGADYRELLR
jgi:ABC-type multidrug transport system fused ATPase/permease subunit